ncbi:MAG: DUF2189 domain-containing protein [Caulobacteraceae bacterium]
MAANAIVHAPTPAHLVGVRRIGFEDLKIALQRGFADYRAKRGEMLFLGVIYPIVGLLACGITFERVDMLPLAFPLVAGITLMGPPLASGFYELARRRERGEDTGWKHALDVLKTPPFASIAILTLFTAALFGLWLLCAWAIYTVTLGIEPPTTAGDFWLRLFNTTEGWTMILVGNLIGLVFAIASLAVSAVSFPMLVDRRAGPLTAAETSLRAVAANPVAFGTWGLIVAGLLVLGSIPLFIGLAVVLPVLGYSTWHLYSRAVEG